MASFLVDHRVINGSVATKLLPEARRNWNTVIMTQEQILSVMLTVFSTGKKGPVSGASSIKMNRIQYIIVVLF